ncbi:hypothetical protein ASPCAL09784 [Aspergillus calidoustus]|uniref:Uncharacterized protein n=1 Tax=Aspergillus calidoustus TaxID=454130 RepID=A0A0U5GZ52_ASPCI|nr:hypothetical protein ASPCAL09784 [Aspergillus calidoustus]
MRLLDLPNEILGPIFQWIGQAFFKDDFCRVLICKRWYTFAIRECLREVKITPNKIYRLLHSRTKEQIIQLLQSHAHEIHFTTHDFYPFQAEETEDEDTTLAPLKQWVRSLHNQGIRDLLPILAGCTSLQNLSFRTWRGVYGLYAASEQDMGEKYWLTTLTEEFTISSAIVADVLSVGYMHSLASLELDLRGCECVAASEEGKLPIHLCPSVAGLLSQKHMRRLSICVHSVCPDILQPVSISEPEKPGIWVEEFVLNITPDIGKHSQLCYGQTGEEAVPFVFEQLARNLLSQMARPKIVRVVSHDHPTPESIDIAYYLRVYDAIVDEARLAECVPWTGEPLSLRSFKRPLEDLF